MSDYDLIVLGAGTSGFPSAKIAASMGKKVLLAGSGALGGKCIVNGCIPAKALIYSAKLCKYAQKARNFGILIGSIESDYTKVVNFADKLVHMLVKNNEEALAQYDNIDYIKENGNCISPDSVEIGSETYSAPKMLISTGTKPFIPPIEGINKVSYLTHESIFNLRKIPKSIAFVGGGFISLEFANVFNTFGSKVYIIDTNPLPIFRADSMISEKIKEYYEQDGIEFIANSRTSRVSKTSTGIQLETNTGKLLEVDSMMLSTGFTAKNDELMLDKAGIKTDNRGNIVVNEYLQTSVPNIYAIGDILGKSQFTHMALRESKIVIHNIFNEKNRIALSFENVPYAVFTDPPIGSVGKTEQFLKEHNIHHKVSLTNFSDSSRGALMKLKRGSIKMLYSDEKILGCHIIGEGADLLIHEIVPLIHLSNGLSIFKKIVHAHPTLSELFRNIQEQIGFI